MEKKLQQKSNKIGEEKNSPPLLLHGIRYRRREFMQELPKIDPSIKVVNEALLPYFIRVVNEIRLLNERDRHRQLRTYRIYLEDIATNTTNKALRIQIRINLAALLDSFDYNGPKSETNVLPKKALRIFDGDMFRFLSAEEGNFTYYEI